MANVVPDSHSIMKMKMRVGLYDFATLDAVCA